MHQNCNNMAILPGYKTLLFECFPIKMEITHYDTHIAIDDLNAEYTMPIRKKYSHFIENLHLDNTYFTNYILLHRNGDAKAKFKNLITNSIIQLDHIIPMHDTIMKFINVLINYIKNDTLIESNWYRFNKFWELMEFIVVTMDIYNKNCKYKQYFVHKQEFISILGIFMYQSKSPYNIGNQNSLTPNKAYCKMGSRLFSPKLDSIYHILSALISFCDNTFTENDYKLLHFKTFYRDIIYDSRFYAGKDLLSDFCQILAAICFDNLDMSEDVIKTVLFHMHQNLKLYRIKGYFWAQQLNNLWTIIKHLVSINDDKKKERMKLMFFKGDASLNTFVDDIDNETQQRNYCRKVGILQFIQYAPLQDMEYCQYSKEKVNEIISDDKEFSSFIKSIYNAV